MSEYKHIEISQPTRILGVYVQVYERVAVIMILPVM